MAEQNKKKAKKGGSYCVAGAPNDVSCKNNTYTAGVSMHYFPKNEVVRQKWIKFVRRHRKDFKPSNSSVLCSVHFEDSCFEHRPIAVPRENGEFIQLKKGLISGSIPTRDTVMPHSSPLTSRKRRRMMREAVNENIPAKKRRSLKHTAKNSVTSTTPDASAHLQDLPSTPGFNVIPSEVPEEESDFTVSVTPAASSQSSDVPCPINLNATPLEVPLDSSGYCTLTTPIGVSQPQKVRTAPPKCGKCSEHSKKRKALKRQHNRLKKRFKRLQIQLKELQNPGPSDSGPEEESDTLEDVVPLNIEDEESMAGSQDDDQENRTDEPDWANLEDSAASTEESGDEDPLEADPNNNIRVEADTPPHEGPAFIVFYCKLLQIFSLFCFICKRKNPTVTMKQNGTMVTVEQQCPSCGDQSFRWSSQPLILGKFPAGNILLSFAVLMAGASISKVLLVFKHLGLAAYTARTFFNHQKMFLFPVILQYWETYRASLVTKLKDMTNVAWSGDGRFDSMGHSAKYSAYTMFCPTIMKVVHFELLQANETGGSYQMELEGAKRAFAYLMSVGLKIAVFVSDRHRGVAKWLRECQPNTVHFFDIWHVARSIGKKMLTLSKQKGCERISQWIKGVRNHLHWCASSTKQGFKELIAAKWMSLMRHISNKHDNHQTPLFDKCAHGADIDKRKWIKIGTTAYDKLNSLLTGTRLVNDIKQLSGDAQTSCLEGLHATLNHWHPKMVCFSWLGTYCRHILASLHFNENIHRECQTSKDGTPYMKVTYPKFKLGDEVVREVAVPPTYGYVQEIKELLFAMTKEKDISQLKAVYEKYSANVPESLSSQFPDRPSKPEAVHHHIERTQKETSKLYPSAERQDALQASTVTNTRGNGQRSGRGTGRTRQSRANTT
ncbi:uncharacterized protein [Acropora muricata]|uniref:uncharacterized protein isoform X1 n=1 Tax=Acropora muricata TaxID=159855 RepID=UPI0034E52CF5